MALCDTNVLSELFKLRPNSGVTDWAERNSNMSVSAITLDETWYGLARRPRPRLRELIESFVAARCEVLPVTAELARRAGDLRGYFATRGINRSQLDMLIAATAQVHQLTLITRNVRDFEGCAIQLLNPFT